MPKQPTYVLVEARALRELTEAVNAANLDVAKRHHRLTADGCCLPDHPLYEPLALRGSLSWTDNLVEAFPTPKDDLAVSLRDVVGARLNADGSATAILRSDRVQVVDAPSPDELESMVANMKRVGPVVTAAFVDGRMKVFHDGVPAPDSPWQHVMDAQQHEADRIMVRAVSLGYPGPDDERDTWALDCDATGHRAPFARGDLVIRSSGREGTHRVVDLTVDKDALRHRSLRLTVEPTDVVVDADAF